MEWIAGMESQRLHELQQEIARYCRGLDTSPGLELDGRRLEVYRSLVFGAFFRNLKRAFPIAFSILGGEEFSALVQEFVTTTPSTTPYFWELPRGFVDFCRTSRVSNDGSYPFLPDLLEFEFAEIEVNLMPDIAVPKLSDEGDPLADPLVLNPESKVLQLTYPVFRTTDPQSLKEQHPTTLLVFRHPDTKGVQFMEVTGVAEALVLLLKDGPERAAKLQQGEVRHGSEEEIEKGVAGLFGEGAILGFMDDAV